MEKPFASLCILAWKRPQMLIECIDSLIDTLDFPCEIIVSVDGEEGIAEEFRAEPIAQSYLRAGKISKLVMVGGKNRGVGRSFQNALMLAEGDIIFKIDSDLIFEKGWLSTSVRALTSNPDVGCLSLFNYRNYDPSDERFKVLENRSDCDIVTDLVSSILAFRAEDLHLDVMPTWPDGKMEDDGFQQRLTETTHRKLAITKKDYVKNVGFGKNSVYLTFDEAGNPSKTSVSLSPLTFPLLT